MVKVFPYLEANKYIKHKPINVRREIKNSFQVVISNMYGYLCVGVPEMWYLLKNCCRHYGIG